MDSRYAAWAAKWRVPLGFAMGVAFVILSQPTLPFLMTGGGIALLGLLLRALAAGFLEKGRALATAGPYRFTRNPLYLGSFFMGVGFALAAGSWPLGLAFLVFFLLVYWPVMRREEDFLRRQFGDEFARYAASTPLFFPTFVAAFKVGQSFVPEEKFRWERYKKNHEYEAALGYLVGLVFLAVKLQLR
ncbi:MAG: methyltransferase family protein [Terriglobia bacterium]